MVLVFMIVIAKLADQMLKLTVINIKSKLKDKYNNKECCRINCMINKK